MFFDRQDEHYSGSHPPRYTHNASRTDHVLTTFCIRLPKSVSGARPSPQIIPSHLLPISRKVRFEIHSLKCPSDTTPVTGCRCWARAAYIAAVFCRKIVLLPEERGHRLAAVLL